MRCRHVQVTKGRQVAPRGQRPAAPFAAGLGRRSVAEECMHTATMDDHCLVKELSRWSHSANVMHACGKCMTSVLQYLQAPSLRGPSQAQNLFMNTSAGALVHRCNLLHDRWSPCKSAPLCAQKHQQAAQTCATCSCVEALRRKYVGSTNTCGRHAGTAAAGSACAQPALGCQAADAAAARGNSAAGPQALACGARPAVIPATKIVQCGCDVSAL